MLTRHIRLSFFISIICFTGFSQTSVGKDSLISSYISQLTRIWNENNSETFENLLDDKTKKQTNLNFKPALVENNRYTGLLLKRNSIQQSLYKKDVGLSFTAGFQKNSSAPFVDQEDVVVFRQKAQFGVEWDFLKGGLYENRLKVKSLKNEADFLKGSVMAQKSNRIYLTTSEQVVANFNDKKISILSKRADLNQKQLKIIEKLWDHKQISKDDYLKAIQNKTDINGLFELYKSFSEKGEQLKIKKNDTLKTPLLDIDFDKLLKKVNYLSASNDTSLPTSLLNNAKNESKFLKEIGFKAYTRYNYYDVYTQSIPNRSFVSFGMNINVPLTFNGKQKEALYIVNKEIEFQQKKIDNLPEQGVEYVLLNYYYEYRYKLKKYFNLIEKRNVIAEYIRTEKVKQEFKDLEFNPNTALFILDDYWSNAIELLDLHQDMYKILINIKEKVPGSEIQDFTFPITIKEDVKDTTFNEPNVKALYIWSKSLTSETSDLIAEYCEINDFNEIIISYKNNKEYIKILKNYLNKHYTKRISLMTGNNSLINGGFKKLTDSIASQLPMNYLKGFHLDIEPHTFDDFKEKKDEYFNKYINLIDSAANFSKRYNLRLSVSIPLNYPDTVLKKIFLVCDKVYLMAYENIEPEFINKKIVEEVGLNKNKVVLALRAKDFKSREEMNQHFREIGIKHIAYHDYETLLNLDKKEIQKKEENKK